MRTRSTQIDFSPMRDCRFRLVADAQLSSSSDGRRLNPPFGVRWVDRLLRSEISLSCLQGCIRQFNFSLAPLNQSTRSCRAGSLVSDCIFCSRSRSFRPDTPDRSTSNQFCTVQAVLCQRAPSPGTKAPCPKGALLRVFCSTPQRRNQNASICRRPLEP